MPPAHILLVQLPQEVIDLILDHVSALADGLPRDLGACALTCRAFRFRSQMHLFSTVGFKSEAPNTRGRLKRAKAFRKILRGNKDIAQYIRVIRLSIWSFDIHWIREDPHFADILILLCELGGGPQKLEIEGLNILKPQAFPGIILDNPLYPFHPVTSSITSLRLVRIVNIPPIMISSCVNLTQLQMISAEISTVDCQSALENGLPLPKIESLDFYQTAGILGVVLDTFPDRTAIVDLSNLRFLRSSINPQNAPSMIKIIDVSANHLEEIHLKRSLTYDKYHYEDVNEILFPFDLSRLHRLRALSITIAADSRVDLIQIHKVLDSVCDVICSIPRANIFETLDLYADFEVDDAKIFMDDNTLWQRLDSEVSALASQRRISFNIHLIILPWSESWPDSSDSVETSDEVSSPDFEALLSKQLQQCVESSDVTVNVFLNSDDF